MKKGFSLVELLIALAVCAGLITLTIGTFPRFTQRLALDNSARFVASDLRALQGRAQAEHKTIFYQPAEVKLPRGIIFARSAPLAFASSGYPTVGGSGTLILRDRFGREKKVILSSAGRVRLE